jgi:hypothetical protein
MKVVRLPALRTSAFTPRKYSWYLFLLEAKGHSAAGRIMTIKIPMTQTGIDPATFQFVAQCLNHYVTAYSLHQYRQNK